MKSPLLRAFFTPHVHPRLRKRPPRCTLDCGFKTSESPALRGFEAERGPIRGTSLYLVLKSNGLPRPKIRLKKFGFSSKSVPANIAKKLPSQRCFKPLLIPIFNFPHKRPTLVFAGESGYTPGFAQRIAHKGTYGETRGVSDGGWYHYPRSVPHVHEHPRAGCQNGKFCRFWGLVGDAPEERRKPSEQRCAYARRCSEGVAAPLGCVICLQLGDVAVFSLCAQYFLNVRGGGGITTLGAFHTVRKPCVAGYQNGKLCRFWVLAGCTLEERREPTEQRCAYARRCSEASRPRWAA